MCLGDAHYSNWAVLLLFAEARPSACLWVWIMVPMVSHPDIIHPWIFKYRIVDKLSSCSTMYPPAIQNLNFVLLLSSNRCLHLMFSAHLRKVMFCWRCSRLNQFVIPSEGWLWLRILTIYIVRERKLVKALDLFLWPVHLFSCWRNFVFVCIYYCICLSEYPRNCTELMLTSLLVILP